MRHLPKFMFLVVFCTAVLYFLPFTTDTWGHALLSSFFLSLGAVAHDLYMEARGLEEPSDR